MGNMEKEVAWNLTSMECAEFQRIAVEQQDAVEEFETIVLTSCNGVKRHFV